MQSQKLIIVFLFFTFSYLRLLLEPNIIKRILEYKKELENGKPPSGEDFINKNDLISQDLFCILYIVLNLCNGEFFECYNFYQGDRQNLISFNREKFKETLGGFIFHISHDRELVWVFKKLLCIEKYNSGWLPQFVKSSCEEIYQIEQVDITEIIYAYLNLEL